MMSPWMTLSGLYYSGLLVCVNGVCTLPASLECVFVMMLLFFFPSRTKRLLVDIIRVQSDDSVSAILDTKATPEQVMDKVQN